MSSTPCLPSLSAGTGLSAFGGEAVWREIAWRLSKAFLCTAIFSCPSTLIISRQIIDLIMGICATLTHTALPTCTLIIRRDVDIILSLVGLNIHQL